MKFHILLYSSSAFISYSATINGPLDFDELLNSHFTSRYSSIQAAIDSATVGDTVFVNDYKTESVINAKSGVDIIAYGVGKQVFRYQIAPQTLTGFESRKERLI